MQVNRQFQAWQFYFWYSFNWSVVCPCAVGKRQIACPMLAIEPHPDRVGKHVGLIVVSSGSDHRNCGWAYCYPWKYNIEMCL